MSKGIVNVAAEIEDYFLEQYGKSTIRVVPGHWPVMKSKEDVDSWLETLASLKDVFDVAFAEDSRKQQNRSG